jgi:uncharacterized protein YjeT (DUF2065 family)
MERTRKSLFFVAFYLLQGGLAFLFVPRLALELFHATGDYHQAPVQFVGVLLLTLGIVVAQLVRTRAEKMYSATLIARSIILPGIAMLYWAYRDPLFIVLGAIVGSGYILTWICYWLDRHQIQAG